MGCDIHMNVEKKNPNGTYDRLDIEPFNWRSYGMFGFLAGVRNYSAVPPISDPRGLPDGISPRTSEVLDWEIHSVSWLSVDELKKFDYDVTFEDLRVMRNNNGGCTGEPGEGEIVTFREFLGEQFFDDLEALVALDVDRIVFGFDN